MAQVIWWSARFPKYQYHEAVFSKFSLVPSVCSNMKVWMSVCLKSVLKYMSVVMNKFLHACWYVLTCPGKQYEDIYKWLCQLWTSHSHISLNFFFQHVWRDISFAAKLQFLQYLFIYTQLASQTYSKHFFLVLFVASSLNTMFGFTVSKCCIFSSLNFKVHQIRTVVVMLRVSICSIFCRNHLLRLKDLKLKEYCFSYLLQYRKQFLNTYHFLDWIFLLF